MKTILLFILFLTFSSLNSQWTRVTNKVVDFRIVYGTKPYVVNGDSVYVFRDKVGWFKSYDSGENWEFDNNVFRNDEGEIMYPIHFSPIFKDSMVYFYDGNSGFLQISSDYGKSFKSAEVYSSHNESYSKFVDLHALTFDNDVIFATSNFGVYISFDKGYNWQHKSLPGRWRLTHLPTFILYENPEELPGGLQFDNATDIAVIDTTLFVSSFMGWQGGVHKSINYHKNDTNNSVYFPILQEYLLKKYNDPNLHTYTRSFNIMYFRNKLYVILTDRIIPGGGVHVAGTYSKVWISEDKGETWEEQDYSNFGVENVKMLFECGDYLYLVEDAKGVFMSGDEGKSWELLNVGFIEEPNEQKDHLKFGFMQFTENYAYISNGWNLYRAPLKNCKIVTEQSSVETTETEPKIYPNPASESITISGIGQGIVTIYNTLGQKLIEKEIFGTSTINTNDLQTGMYVVKLESGGEVVFEKVIVNR